MATILLVAILAFGLQIPWLGFFQDDWNFVFYSSVGGPQGLLEYLTLDGRPGGAWVYILGFGLLGYEPALWQFFSLVLRISTTITFWLLVANLWPQRRYGNLITALFFLTYPFFTLQPQAVAYALHWMAYLLYAISVLLMIKAAEQPEKYIFFSAPAVLFAFAHLLSVEYFVGLELLRPLILWFVLTRKEKGSFRTRLQRTFQSWLPYLGILIFFVLWRSLILADIAAQNNPLGAVLDPQVLVSVAQNALADWVLMFFGAWFNLIHPALFVVGPARNAFLWVIILAGACCFYFLAKQNTGEDREQSHVKSVFFAGILIFAAGMISAYSIGYIVHLKTAPWNSRFVLPAMGGLALLSSGSIEAVVTSPRIRHLVFAVLMGLLVGWHNQNTLNFKSAWEKQTRLYEQLLWRAPSIKPGTPILANEEILGYMGDYPTGFALNTIYEARQFNHVPLWFFAFSGNYSSGVNQAGNGEELAARQSTSTFRGKKQDAIVITYEPENNQCLWVLRPQDRDYKNLPDRIKEAVQTIDSQSIQPGETTHRLFQTIVRENTATWCYFYQKADLARQQENWEDVLHWWEAAQSNGYHPGSGFEYIPFIEAQAHLGNWEDAFQLTRTANKAIKGMYLILCPTWQRLTQETPASGDRQAYVEKANDFLGCAP